MEKEKTVTKLNLTMLKELVKELDSQLEKGYTKFEQVSYTLEMSKASGLLSGIAKEAVLLVADLEHHAVLQAKSATNSSATATQDVLDLLGLGKKTPTGFRN